MHTPEWFTRAACRGQPAELWFRPVDPDTGRVPRGSTWSPLPAQRICARCPVARQCLDRAVENTEMVGLWAGYGGDILRQLRRTRRGSPNHRDDRDDCDCRYCRALTTHIERLQMLQDPDIKRIPKGPSRVTGDARHGVATTYNRGCRCTRCRFRRSAAGERLHAAGIDVADWWDCTYGPDHGYDDDPDTTADECGAARERVIVNVAHSLPHFAEMTGHTRVWLIDLLESVVDPDIARQILDPADTARLIGTTQLDTVAAALGVDPADILEPPTPLRWTA